MAIFAIFAAAIGQPANIQIISGQADKKTMKFSVNLIIFSLILLMHTVQAEGRGTWKRETDAALGAITEERLYREISFLSDTLCKGRATGTKGNIDVAFWITRKFEKAGLKQINGSYASHFTTPTGANAHNIIGMIPGSLSVPRKDYVIVGAHFDHLGELHGVVYPGADANASGTVAMTSLAETFGAMKLMGKVYDSNIIFVAFDAKEMNMAGSDALWKMIEYGILKDPLTGETITRECIKLMVNIDQIGSTLSPVNNDRPDYMIMLGNESLPKKKRMNLEACNGLHGTNLDLCLSYYGSQTFTRIFYRLSDQRTFVDNNIPAVQFTSGITMNTNKTRDTASSLDMEILKKRITLIYHWIESML